MITNSLVLNLDALTALIVTGKPLDGVKVHLFITGPTLNPLMQVSDFVEATFTGATAQAITWGTPFSNPNNQAEVTSNAITFSCTGGTPNETILGYFVTDTAGTVLLFADYFDAPIGIAAVGQGFSLVIGYTGT